MNRPVLSTTLAALAACLTHVANGAEPEWRSLLRDPAANPRWVAADRLLVERRVTGETPAVVEIGASTGERRQLSAEHAVRAATRRPGAEPLATVDDGDDTAIVFINDRDADVQLFWVDGGGRAKPYGTVPARGRHEQHTFAGHAWLVREVPLDRSLFATPWSVDEPRWSADGRTVFFLYNQRGHQVVRLLAVDAASGTVRTVVAETSPTFVDYAHKTWCHWLSDDELLWTSERDGWNHLYLVDVAGGTPGS